MKVSNCRLCNSKLSEPKLNLGKTPLANEFIKEKIEQDLFPLEVCVCEGCGHYQLNEQADPERMFRNYYYVAGTSPVNVEHFRQYAQSMITKFNLKSGSKILDIASNDGTLLKHFKDLGMSVLGIDPAKNLAEEANKDGIPTIPEFFTEQYAATISEKYGQFDLITANNVFAHCPNLIDFTKGVRKLLKSNGVFSFEVSYFGDVVDKNLFDTLYHEHTSYHTIKPLISFFNLHHMKIIDLEFIPNHGGSVRIFVSNKDEANAKGYWCPSCGKEHAADLHYYTIPSVINAYKNEANIAIQIRQLQKNIKLLGYELREKLQEFKSQGKSIAIYGVPAKATTLMYALNIDEKVIDFAVDDAVLKQGTYTPGKHISVLHPDVIYEKKPDVLLVLGWNFAESIIKKHSAFKGTWIVPLPEIKVINGRL